MKKLLFVAVSLVAAAFILVPSCKKKDDNSSSTSTPTTPTTSTICDGNGKTTYFPLDSTDSWTFSCSFMGQNEGSATVTVIGHNTYSGVNYAELNDPSHLLYTSDNYYREDATTHNIYWYDTYGFAEYLLIPASPTLNQTWTASSSTTKTVLSLSATYTTSSCSYTGLLEIGEYSSGTLKYTYYYKKGLGEVAEVGDAYGDLVKLTSVKLK
jgi:hypothetical protein